MRFFALLSIVVAFGLSCHASTNGSYADVLRTRKAAATALTALRSMPDGCHYTIIRDGDIVRYAYDRKGEGDILFSTNINIHGYELAPSAESALIFDRTSLQQIYRHSFTSDCYFATAEGASRILECVRDVTFSPDATCVAYSRNNNLYLYNIATCQSTAITDDGRWNEVINGTSDWVYEEEYGFTRAYAFSPDSRYVAYLRFDESQVPLFEMMRFDATLYNRAYTFKYPKAGDSNSTVEVWLYDRNDGSKQRIATNAESDDYLLNLAWTPSGQLYFYRINRLQNHFEVVMLQHDGSLRTIYEEQSPRYVERPNASTITFIDEHRFVVLEESSRGWAHLYLHDTRKGRIAPITEGRWEVTNIISATKERILYLSTERSPLNRDLYSIRPNGRGKQRLSQGDGFHLVEASTGGKYYIQTASNASTPSIVTLHRGDGKIIDTLADRRKAVAECGAWPTRHFRTFTTERGDTLNYYIQMPTNFDPSRRYPVLLTQYSGPGSQSARNRWSLDWEDALAAHGYIVACCDGRGTGFRGEEFKKCTYADLGRREREDQISFARYLANQPWVDAERIGIYGWSYGGFMALNCALHGEGLFRMAIAVAPVTSWRYYDTIYTEIYNGLPQTNPRGYDDNSPLSHAEKLAERTQLLIIHGTADDNVHFQNSMEMCRRLNAAGKQYDMMVYPDQNHSMLPSATSLVRQKMIDYTLDNL